MQRATALLVGGPHDQTPVWIPSGHDVHLVDSDGRTHRYRSTESTRRAEAGDLTVFTYDGAAEDDNPHGP
jgi:hypothetical protein